MSRFTLLDHLPQGTIGYLSGGGLLAARRIVRELAQWLASNGAVLRVDTDVAELNMDSADCRFADGSRDQGDRLIVAPGAWASSLLGPHVSLTAKRQVSLLVRVPEVFSDAWSGMPVVLR